MPKITRFDVTNFQSWKDVSIRLHEGVNVIIGPSDEGKSALMRALRWGLRNKVKGPFINYDAKKKDIASVKIFFDNKIWIDRQKNSSGTINQYLVKGFKDPLTALKHDLPKEIMDITGIADYNIQRQKKWFLLEDKPSEVAKKFNNITGLDVIDDVIKIANSEVKKSVNTLEFEKEELSKLQQKYEDLDWVEEMVGIFADIKSQYEIVNKNRMKIERIRRLIETHDTLYQKVKRIEPAIYLKAEITHLISNKRELDKIKREKEKIRSIITRYKETKSVSKKLKRKLKTLFDIVLMDSEYKNIKKLYEEHGILEKILYTENVLQMRISELKDYWSKAKSLFDKVLKQLGKCPTCGSKI